MRMRIVLSFLFVVGALGFLYSDRQDEVVMARTTWEQAAALDQPSVQAKTLLCRLERHEHTILAEGIASPDSFATVSLRLNGLWAEYCRLEDQLANSPPDLGGVAPKQEDEMGLLPRLAIFASILVICLVAKHIISRVLHATRPRWAEKLFGSFSKEHW